MGTNYEARIIPSKKRKKELIDAIKADDFTLIGKLREEMYDSIHMDWNTDSIEGGIVHLGKASGGWKFLWNPNVFVIRNGHSEWIDNPDGSRSSRWIHEPDTMKYLYPLTKKGIKAFIDREDVVIYDEYDEKQDKEEFWKMAIGWTKWKDPDTGQMVEAWDSDTYYDEHPREAYYQVNNEITDMLIQEGYKLSELHDDFYSDGLRFSTSTEFS